MKSFASILALFAAINFAAATSSLAPDLSSHGWEKLGERKVNYGLDRDEIIVTAAEGRFTALKFLVKKGGINLHKVVVHFGDGSKEEIETRNNLQAGGESRVIDLPGRKRVIQKVVFWYDTKNFSDRKAELELWGRH